MSDILTVVVSNTLIAAMLALLTVVVTRLWRNPQLAHACWALVLLKLITPPVTGLSVPNAWLNRFAELQSVVEEGDAVLPPPSEMSPGVTATAETFSGVLHEADGQSRGSMPAASTVEVTPDPNQGTRWSRWEFVRWPLVAGTIWIAGIIVCVGLMSWRCCRFRHLLACADDAGGDVTDAARKLAEKLGLKRCPRIRVVDAPIPPLVWSLGLRPKVLLPGQLFRELAPAQRDAVIAHELAHIKRGDHLLRWLDVIVLMVFWWNPLAWFARRKLREAEEECCDAWVVWALPEERRSYGQAMLKTMEFLAEGRATPALVGTAFGSSFYKRRIEMIMRRNMNRKMSPAAVAVTGLLAVAVLPLSARTGDELDNAEPAEEDAHSFYPKQYDSYQDSSFFTAQIDDEQPGAGEPKPNDEEDRFVRELKDEISASKARLRQVERIRLAEELDRLRRLTEELNSMLNDSGTQSEAKDVLNAEIRGDVVENIGQANSLEAILKRVTALEQSLKELQAEAEKRTADTTRSADAGAGASGARLSSWPTVPSQSQVPKFTISPHAEEQELQERLLQLDVEAAEEALATAKRRFEQVSELGDAVSGKELDTQRNRLREQEIQLERAKTVLQLFKLQARREREQAKRWEETRRKASQLANPQLAPPEK